MSSLLVASVSNFGTHHQKEKDSGLFESQKECHRFWLLPSPILAPSIRRRMNGSCSRAKKGVVAYGSFCLSNQHLGSRYYNTIRQILEHILDNDVSGFVARWLEVSSSLCPAHGIIRTFGLPLSMSHFPYRIISVQGDTAFF